MTTLAEPDVTPAQSDGDGDVDHLYCCDPDLSLCGLDIAGLEFGCGDDSQPVCPTCRAARSDPCGDPACPDRTLRWRLRRWWRDGR